MARILGVGNAALDIVNVVDAYPAEDQEVRASDQSIRLGGNTANTLVVLAGLGHRCTWAGTLADEPDTDLIREAFRSRGIDLSAAQTITGGKLPTSYITLSRATGSRTIVHYRDLKELDAWHFRQLDLSRFDWIHFEARNIPQLADMMVHARAAHPEVAISLEMEKPRGGSERILSVPDLILFSAAFARHSGFDAPQAFLEAMASRAPQADLVCAWGEKGAAARSPDGAMFTSPAFPPPRVVDTVGAGDAFNAAVIHALIGGRTLGDAVRDGCRLAGGKCGQMGLDGLAKN